MHVVESCYLRFLMHVLEPRARKMIVLIPDRSFLKIPGWRMNSSGMRIAFRSLRWLLHNLCRVRVSWRDQWILPLALPARRKGDNWSIRLKKPTLDARRGGVGAIVTRTWYPFYSGAKQFSALRPAHEIRLNGAKRTGLKYHFPILPSSFPRSYRKNVLLLGSQCIVCFSKAGTVIFYMRFYNTFRKLNKVTDKIVT